LLTYLQLLRAERRASESLRGVLGQQSLEQALGGLAQPLVQGGRLADHVAQRVVVRSTVERVPPRDHLVHEQSQTPPVHALGVAALQQHLWRHVLLGAAETPRGPAHRSLPLLPVVRQRFPNLRGVSACNENHTHVRTKGAVARTTLGGGLAKEDRKVGAANIAFCSRCCGVRSPVVQRDQTRR